MRNLAERQPAHVHTPEFQKALSERLKGMQALFRRTCMARSGMTQDDMERLTSDLKDMVSQARDLESQQADRSVGAVVRNAAKRLHSVEHMIAVSRTALIARVGEAEIDPEARISAQLADAISGLISVQVDIGRGTPT